jgi:hypothetical protein
MATYATLPARFPARSVILISLTSARGDDHLPAGLVNQVPAQEPGWSRSKRETRVAIQKECRTWVQSGAKLSADYAD